MDNHNPSGTTHNQKQHTLGRRRLLQALGSAVAISMLLPEEWAKPVLEVGYLPAHAQTSPPILPPGHLVISNPNLVRLDPLVDCISSSGFPGHIYQVSFDYDSSFGDVLPGTVVHHAYQFLDGGSGAFDYPLTATHIGGNGLQGQIAYNLCIRFGPPKAQAIRTTVSITTVEGRVSNQLTFDTPRPLGALSNDKSGSPSVSPL
jgi:hypothetical protein